MVVILFIMVLAYFDESGMHSDSPNTVMAGFAGTQQQWEAFIPECQGILTKYNRTSLHMKKLRFRHSTERQMLAELGPLPLKHKLWLFGSHVSMDDHRRIVEGKVEKRFSTPYMCVFQKCVYEAARLATRAKDAVILNFEENREHKTPIEDMRELVNERRQHLIHDIRTVPKQHSPALQAADYLAFQLYHWLISPGSVKSTWGVSIMGHGNSVADAADARWLTDMVESFRAHGGGLD